jgi:hypothetical protein
MATASMTDNPYKVVRIDYDGIRPGYDMEEAVNQMAARGYEFVQAIPETRLGTTLKVLLLFRRRISS